MTEPQLPKEPETEKGRLMRQQYLALAKASLKEAKDYESLYTRYSDHPTSAQGLDQEVARAALQTGKSPRQVIQLLAQGPFTQQQILGLSEEEKKAALPKLLQYAQRTVDSLQQQRYLEYACSVTGKIQSYPDIYRDYVSSDLTAIQLDQKVTAAALGTGELRESVATLLHQGPYARFQQDVQGMAPQAIEQYARETVAQVQAIQSLQSGYTQRSPRFSQKLGF
jgi:Mg/Co/Ni transporter MgtE